MVRCLLNLFNRNGPFQQADVFRWNDRCLKMQAASNSTSGQSNSSQRILAVYLSAAVIPLN